MSARGPPGAAPGGRGCGPSRRRRCGSRACRVRRRGARGAARRIGPGQAGVHRAPVPAACYLAPVDAAAADRAPAVPQPAVQPVLQARRGGALPRPARRPGGRPDQRPDRPRLQRVPRQRTGACSASSSARTTRRPRDALLGAAEAWHRERERDRMVGPMDFATNDESGIVDRGLRARRDDPPAVAPARTTASCSSGRGWRRRWTCSCGSWRSPTASRSCP